MNLQRAARLVPADEVGGLVTVELANGASLRAAHGRARHRRPLAADERARRGRVPQQGRDLLPALRRPAVQGQARRGDRRRQLRRRGGDRPRRHRRARHPASSSTTQLRADAVLQRKLRSLASNWYCDRWTRVTYCSAEAQRSGCSSRASHSHRSPPPSNFRTLVISRRALRAAWRIAKHCGSSLLPRLQLPSGSSFRCPEDG